MTTPHRSFTTRKREPTAVTFEVGGDRRIPLRRGDTETATWAETFTTLDEPPAAVLDNLIAGISTDERGNRTYSAPSLIRFVAGVLVPEDEERWWALVNDKDRLLDLQTLGDIVIWLSEALTDRPTIG